MILTKITSSMEKCFLDSNIADYAELKHISALKNERISFQLLYTDDTNDITVPYRATSYKLQIEGIDKALFSVRRIENVPVTVPSLSEGGDGNFLRTAPGLYPDPLLPLHKGGIFVMRGQLQALWVEINLSEQLRAGEYPITLKLLDGQREVQAESSLTLTVIDALLPPQEMILTQWFHCDCLATYYNVDAWSEEHWRIVENFAATAAKNGINMLLTPVHTPPLDTAMGRERKTVQLVDVTVEDGTYAFNFDKLDRWIEMCNRVGIRYFEIAHLFTQWGAAYAPKIMATADGEYKRIFGWETDATSEEYTSYLRAFLTAFLGHMKARGDDKRCYFHMSDEPNKLHIDRYRAVKAGIADILAGYPIMDALSNFEFYQDGLVELPIPASDHIKPFIEADVKGLWTYYCCSQDKGVSNRFIAMPLWRTRSIGLQFYKFNIVGFLHWGYNFYNAALSRNSINPYVDTCAGNMFPAGDAFSVYPAQDGSAVESIRILSFYEALQDARALKLAEELCGRDRVIEEIETLFGDEIAFDKCAKSAETLLAIRERINEMIEEAIK